MSQYSIDDVPAMRLDDAAVGYAGRVPARRRQSGARLFLMLFGFASIAVVGVLLALLLASNTVVKPMVRDAALEDLRSGIRTEVDTQIATQLEQTPAGEIVISAAEINRQLAQSENLGPIDDATVEIWPDGLVVALQAYGVSGTYRSSVHASNGAVVLDPGSIDGPLGFVIPNDDLAAAVNAEIAAALAAAGYTVDAVTMTEGAIVLAISSQL